MKRTNLIAARHEHGWSQEYLAEQIGVDYSTIQRWEHGETTPHPRRILQLCQLFGKTAKELDLEHATAQSGATVPEDTTGEIYQAFRVSDLTMRLFHLVWNYPCSDTRHKDLQARIALELENQSVPIEDPLSRRDAMRRLASMAIEYCSLSALQPIYRRPIEEILIQCAAGVTACWQLRKGKDLAFVSDTLAKYLPTLEDIAKVASSEKLRQTAADLAAQGYILESLLANHLDSRNKASLSYARQAMSYAEKADNIALQILALRTQANAYDYANHWDQALKAAQQAERLLKIEQSNSSKQGHLLSKKKESFPPLLVSYIYAGLANYQGHTGQKQEALASLQIAHTAFFQQSPDEPLLIWIDHNQANLLLHDGLTHYYLGLQKDARDSFEQIGELQGVKETTRIEALIDQVLAEVEREDRPRDLDYCMRTWRQGIQEAITLQSEARFDEAVMAFTAMRAAWPTESCIKELRQHIIHW